MPTIDTSPKLYVGTYGKYNNGSIAGKWLDLEDYSDAEEFFKACAEVHKDDPDPEYMFQDFENFPKELYSESMSSEDIEKLINFAKLTEEEREVYTAFYDVLGGDYGEHSIEDIEEALVFTVDTSSPYTTEEQLGLYYEESGFIDIPDHIRSYFDFEAYGRDAMNDLSDSDGYIFDLSNV